MPSADPHLCVGINPSSYLALRRAELSGTIERFRDPSVRPISYALGTTTLTFLFTDIEGSTALIQRVGETTYSQILVDHHGLIRAGLAAHDGTEIDTQGDSFFAVFASPKACAAAVAEVQRSLDSHPWPADQHVRVRIGIHAGEAQQTVTGLVGYDVHKAARVAAAAHGGQVLLSESAAALVHDSLPEGSSLVPLGSHRLKDLGRPEQIFQLNVPGLPNDFPPIRSLNNPELENNVPVQLSSFIGRDKELSDIRSLVESSRLVTLSGPGGSGKTRLALRVAAEMLDGSGGGVWFVELAPIADPEFVASTVAQAMRLREEPGRSVETTLMDAIGERHLLIVLDNCEHLIVGCAKLTDALMRACPKVHVLATSREPLAITGERVYRVPTLSVPADVKQHATDAEAVRLFVERAAEAWSEFVLDEHNTKMVASICRRLDGMPLSIELAAARVGSMDLTEIEGHLDQRFALLTSTSRTALPRHQSLRALIDWSYELLTDFERAVLCRLSVFASGWDLPSAQAARVAGATEVFDIADALRSLVDKSLIQTDLTAFGLCYRLLETIRQFATEALNDRGAREVDLAALNHAEAYLAFAERAAPELEGAEQKTWLEHLDLDRDNLHAAMGYFVRTSDAERALRMGDALRVFWSRRGHFAEAQKLLSGALEIEYGQQLEVLRARALFAIGDLIESYDDRPMAAQPTLEDSLRLAERLDDQVLCANVLRVLARIHLRQGDVTDATARFDQALTIARSNQDQNPTGKILTDCASLLTSLGDVERARDNLAEALMIHRATGDLASVGHTLNDLGWLELCEGDPVESRTHLEEAAAIFSELGNHSALEAVLGNMAIAALLQEDNEGAIRAAEKALAFGQRSGHRYLPYSLLAFALTAYAVGDHDRSTRLHGASDALLENNGETLESLESNLRLGNLEKLRLALGEEAFEISYIAGRNLTRADALELAVTFRVQTVP